MNTTAPAHTALNISRVKWVGPRGVARFKGSSEYGVADDTGRLLSRDGVKPASWKSLLVARAIASIDLSGSEWSWVETL